MFHLGSTRYGYDPTTQSSFLGFRFHTGSSAMIAVIITIAAFCLG